MKGFIVFYLNLNDNSTLTMEEYIAMAKRQNAELLTMLAEDGYPTMIVPCFNEACRVEKIDLTTPLIMAEEGEE